MNSSKSRVLEENMIRWNTAPLEAQRVARELSEGLYGKAIGISVHPISGRVFVIQLSANRLKTKIMWEEEGQCEQCNGYIDDMALGDYRCQGGPPDVTIGMPRFCSECLDADDRQVDLKVQRKVSILN